MNTLKPDSYTMQDGEAYFDSAVDLPIRCTIKTGETEEGWVYYVGFDCNGRVYRYKEASVAAWHLEESECSDRRIRCVRIKVPVNMYTPAPSLSLLMITMPTLAF